MRTTRQLRKLFSIAKIRPDLRWPGYGVACLVDGCEWTSLGWDARSNALTSGYRHAVEHDDAEAAS